METSFMDVRATDDPRWSQLNETALRRAYSITAGRGSWCLISRWREDSSLDDNWEQHRVVVDGFRPTVDVQTLMAHFRGAPGTRTRFEPWMFVGRPDGKVMRWVAEWLMRRCSDLAFWGDDSATHILTDDASRCLGEFHPHTIVSAIRESSATRANFIGFDLPTSTLKEAMARAAYVGQSSFTAPDSRNR